MFLIGFFINSVLLIIVLLNTGLAYRKANTMWL
ncbi:hypothetical protein CPS_2572 [Colwellia psychrerythraea 34H]|uniref:Uncharacterized protein n=1 Tax=Colwellia psychrerythraea (strain 34H / ATCC BAA-681) TaxID=167879 RepID=Q481I2_COLP3|nr:hypothetical protein CPS_2572 [Colwellia psychrerythraea 34H]